MPFIEIETQLDEAIDFMGDLVTNEERTRRSILSQVAGKAKTRAKRSYNSILKKKSGNLYRSIRKYVYRNGRAAVVTAHKPEDKIRYGFALAHGFDSVAKNHPTLTFFSQGKWVRQHSVHVNAKDFIEGPVLNYLNSPQADSDINTITQKLIDKAEQRAAKKAGMKA